MGKECIKVKCRYWLKILNQCEENCVRNSRIISDKATNISKSQLNVNEIIYKKIHYYHIEEIISDIKHVGLNNIDLKSYIHKATIVEKVFDYDMNDWLYTVYCDVYKENEWVIDVNYKFYESGATREDFCFTLDLCVERLKKKMLEKISKKIKVIEELIR